MNILEGDFATPAGKFVLVAGRFNAFVVESLVSGAVDTLKRHGVGEDQLDLVRVPGAWEIPQVAGRLAQSGRYVAVIALGAVIRGATPHFDHVVGAAARGLGQVALDSDVPVAFGVLTTDTIEQAIERAGTKSGNKGADAALSALEMVRLYEQL